MPEDRRLAAIMFTDIVGYTALMGRDEDKAFQILRKNRDIQRPIIKKYRGEWLKEMGDGILASFHTASDAVRCAGEIQNAVKKAGISLRIGIHEGEVVFEDSDVLGDGVNVASRLEELAEEGCINISGAVYKDIKNKAGISAKFIEEKMLKNVDEPVKVYKVNCEESSPVTSSKITSDSSLAEKKSIIVLPFVNISPDPDQEYFSDGLTEEIITDLSHIHDLLVISRSSAMTFKGIRKKIKDIAREVNVRYVLEGSVRKAGNHLRITAQLIDALNDVHLWAEKYNGTLDDVFDIQEKVAQSIVDALNLRLSAEEKQSISERPFKDIEAYEYYLKAKREIESFTIDGIDRAIQYLESSLNIIGENAILYAGLSYAYAHRFNIDVKEKYLKAGTDYARKALEIDPDSSEGHFVTGMWYILTAISTNIKKAIYHLKRALEIDPNNCEALAHLGFVYLFLGKTKAAAPLAQKHLSIDPLHFHGYCCASLSHLFEGRPQQALEPMAKAYQLARDVPAVAWTYVLILAYNDKLKEAYSVIEQSEKTSPENVFTQICVFLKFALQRKKEEALRSITPDILKWSSNDFTNPWSIVIGYSLIGEKNEALNWLEKWIDLGCTNYPFLSKYDPFLENIRGEKHFKKLMERIKHEWENFKV